MQKHIEAMQKEMKKSVSNRNLSLVDDRMSRTRSIRQDEVKQLVPIKSLLEKYAPLSEGNGVSFHIRFSLIIVKL